MSLNNKGQLCATVLALLFLFSSVLILFIPTSVAESDTRTSHTFVEQFGEGFDETIVATASSQLDVPRDLEFHPSSSRPNELWVLNRATDSITIISNAGLSGQSFQNKQDAYGYHFMEQSSAIAFGTYHSEFDYQFASAQESRNTYDGQAAPNNFMGPALWPSSLSHFAVENQQQGGPLGSHLDMLHESPNGMGIAHDSGNAYWYNDGYYEELVYYDFQDDHDTGGEDHDDGIVHRYTEITPSRSANIPGHMILDKENGILYISDTGAGRILWVNTDDPTTTNTDIYNSNTRMDEVLEEYREITNVEWGVLDTGLSHPSGIALHGDTLFVSQNGNGKISAYDLASNGKSGTHMQTVDTNANSIMGLEVGPDEHLWYVDGALNRVVRLDPFDDEDGDSVKDEDDNCPMISNLGQDDFDADGDGDLCDDDDDNDTVDDSLEECQFGETGWTSISGNDYDGDGCRDVSEDSDDDNDGVDDDLDDCSKGLLDWTTDTTTDHDSDGCQDDGEDLDDDNDGLCDTAVSNSDCAVAWPGFDRCAKGEVGWITSSFNDIDRDGCRDLTEDDNDDDDAYADVDDWCPTFSGTSNQGVQVGCNDSDGDGWADLEDHYPLEQSQWADSDNDSYGDNTSGIEGDDCPNDTGTSTADLLGCPDDDGDTRSDSGDDFPTDPTQWNDTDNDNFGDNWADSSWDAERVPLGIGQRFTEATMPDSCPTVPGNSTIDRYGCLDSDEDGWSDEGDAFPEDSTQWSDSDRDGYGNEEFGNSADDCPTLPGNSTLDRLGCPDTDGDGWSNDVDAFTRDPNAWSDSDGDGWADQNGTEVSDDCPLEAGNSTIDSSGCIDSDEDGYSDVGDFYPKDAMRWQQEEESSILWFIGIPTLLIILALGLAVVIRGKGGKGSKFSQASPPALSAPQPGTSPHMPAMSTPAPAVIPAPAALAVSQIPATAPATVSTMASVPTTTISPQIPAEGLPDGWTMEQWKWYGEEWLRNNGR